MIISKSLWRKALVTVVAIVGFVSTYEVTILDSKYAARQAVLRETTALPTPGDARLDQDILAQIFLHSDRLRTLPLGLVAFSSEYAIEYDQMAAAVFIGVPRDPDGCFDRAGLGNAVRYGFHAGGRRQGRPDRHGSPWWCCASPRT